MSVMTCQARSVSSGPNPRSRRTTVSGTAANARTSRFSNSRLTRLRGFCPTPKLTAITRLAPEARSRSIRICAVSRVVGAVQTVGWQNGAAPKTESIQSLVNSAMHRPRVASA